MATKSRFFRVATEGATTDGRKIDRSWIEQMAKNFDPKKYGARVWLEHIRGVYADSDFRAYGDVVAVESREVEDGKLALFAQIEPTPDLIAMNKKRQKIYTSVEIAEKFADTGEAYLVGLGVTDSPASLGTEVLTFAAENPKASPFTTRKTSPENLFTEAVETTLEFEEEEDSNTLGKKVKDLLAKFSTKKSGDEARYAQVTEAVEGMAEVVEEVLELAEKQNKQFAASSSVDALKKQVEDLTKSFNDLKGQLDQEPDRQPPRPAATGGKGQQTDC